jgi:hypothetical protein
MMVLLGSINPLSIIYMSYDLGFRIKGIAASRGSVSKVYAIPYPILLLTRYVRECSNLHSIEYVGRSQIQ